jgi:type VI secretion system secreted protein Hcp
MAVDMFFKIDGAKGESTDAAHKESIDVLSWSWGLTQAGSARLAAGGGSGKVSVQDLSFTKYIDASTPNLMKMCADGSHFKKAVLTVRKAGKSPLEYLKITLEDGIISSVSTGGSGGEDRLTETVALNFARFKVEYKPQKADGSGGAAIEAAWDIAQNKAA